MLSIFADEMLSTPEIITFLLVPPPYEKNPCLSNPIPYPEYLYLPKSTIFVKLTAPDKQLMLDNC